MITDIVAPNIFRAKNDWNVCILKSKKLFFLDDFEKNLVHEIKIETGFNPLVDVKYRGAQVCQSRQLFLTMMTLHTNKTLAAIGLIVGKDHATTIHAVKSVNNMYDTNKRFRALYDRINLKAISFKNI